MRRSSRKPSLYMICSLTRIKISEILTIKGLAHLTRTFLCKNTSCIDNFQSENKNSRLGFKKLQKSILDAIFKANYVLLSSRPVNSIGYHIILLIEFFQLFFLIQYSIVCRNEFGHPNVSNLDLKPFMPKLLQQFSNATLFNITDEDISIRGMLQKAQTQAVSEATFRLDEVVKFANPVLYLFTNDGRATYVAVYAFFLAIFYFLLLTFAVFGDYFYKLIRESSSNQLSESTKLVIRALSLSVYLFISVLQVPFLTLLLQSYLCEEDPQIEYYIENLKCNSQEFQIFVTLSTVTLFIYFGVIWIELTLFQTNEFSSTLPWASFDRQTTKFRSLVKLILTAAFILNKSSSSKPYTLLVALAVMLNIIYRRFTEAIIFSKEAHLAVTSYDIIIGAHLIFIPIQLLSKAKESVDMVVIYLIDALLFMMVYGYLQRRKTIMMLQDDVYLNRKNLGRCEIYLQKLFELIQRSNGSDLFIMQGLLSSHTEICTKKDCECAQILAKQDLLHKFEVYNSRMVQLARGNSLQNINFANTPDQPQNVFDPALLSGSHRAYNLAREGTIMSTKSMGGQLSRMPSMRAEKKAQPYLIAPSPYIIGSTVPSKQTHSSQQNNSNHHISSRSLKNLETQNQIMDVESGEIDNIQIHVLSEHNGFNKKEEAEHAENEKKRIFEEAFGYSLESDFPSNHYEQQAKNVKKLQKGFFKFFVVLLNRTIERFPKDPTMRLHLASMFQNIFLNSFKSVYELYNCETLPDLDISQRFTIFNRKVFIEGELYKKHNKIIDGGGHLDITNVFNYNKSFLEFQRCEILATNAALNFWKELLQKNFDAKKFANIQECVKSIQSLHPQDIKIHFRYGMFLVHVINNEYEGIDCLRKATGIHSTIMSAKAGGKNQKQIRGIGSNIENSGACIIVISALVGDEGKILHANDETELLFGHKRKDILGRNVSMLMPYLIGSIHSSFVKKYLMNGRIDWGENIKQTYAVGKDGYLIPIDLLIKVHPAITGDIKIVGIIQQRVEESDQLQINSSSEILHEKNLENTQLLILTDTKGNIANISSGIVRSLGLLPKFFVYNPDNLFSLINIDSIAPQLSDPSFQDQLMTESQIVTFNTTDILMKIDAESVTHEELENAKPYMRKCEAHVLLKNIPLQEDSSAFLYIIRLRSESTEEYGSQEGEKFRQKRNISKTILKNNSGLNNVKSGEDLDASRTSFENHDLNSQSSVASTANNFNSLVRDFKKTLGDRRMPKTLIILNRLIYIILIVSIFLQSFFYARLNIDIEHLQETADTFINAQRRNAMFVILAINVRSYITIGNQLAPNKFSLDALNAIIDRFSLLNKMIQQQQEEVQGLHNYMSQLRDEHAEPVKEFEHMPVKLLYVDDQNTLTYYEQPYRLAMNSFLTDVLMLNNTGMKDLYLPTQYVTTSPRGDYNYSFPQTSLKLKTVYFLITNGIRSLRVMTDLAAEHISTEINSEESTSFQKTTFLTVMIVGIIITAASISLVFYQILQTENIQSDILSLYAYLSMDHISETYSRAIKYMGELIQGSFVKQIAPYKESQAPAIGTFNRTQWVGYDENQSVESQELGREKDVYELMVQRASQEIRIFQCPDLLIKQEILPQKKLKKTKDSTTKQQPPPNLEQNEKPKGDRNFRKMFKDSKKHRSKVSDETTTKSSKGGKGGRVKIQKEQATKASKKLDIATGTHSKKVVSIMMEDDSISSSEHSHRREEPKKVSSEEKMEIIQKAKAEKTEVEIRQTQFKKTYRSKNAWRKSSVVSVGILIVSYFILTYVIHLSFDSTLTYLNTVVPIVLNRYKYIMLTFGIARERVLFNNTLDSMEFDPVYGYDLDYKFNELSIENEEEIATLKNERKSVAEDIVQQMSEFDSPVFCSKVIKDSLTSGETFINEDHSTLLLPSTTLKYQGIIATVFRACNAARLGRIDVLRNLDSVYEMNFDVGDYDGKTPLYYAVRNYQTNTVLYLLDEWGVQINKKDRYGAHPVDYVGYNSKMEKVLYARGAKRTTVKNPIQLQPIAVNKYSMKDNEVRVFWAAYYGDIETLRILDKMGINLKVKDFDSRTPLHIAAAEGYLDITKYKRDGLGSGFLPQEIPRSINFYQFNKQLYQEDNAEQR
ncbi:hypothetical protein FGO68_gene3282 [Halteria grandinella]|uniref:PAS domain-containing protein n=1 Tax=Halteria grandinella TaxID=5974 RepID=A0A8J8P8E6_HALGN|nr:hypothetical protein FGO68_gene3282 [Halteria grandinella]